MKKNTSDRNLVEEFEYAQQRLVTQSSDFSLSAIRQMVDNQTLDLAPRYQRRARWDVVKKSQLIESFIMNVPVPPIYLAEEEYGSYSVIDGKQRLTAIVDFLQQKFQLKGLQRIGDLNGRYFDELPAAIRRALEVRPFLRFITLLKQSDPELKYEVFTRLNRGGETLTDQEVRNAAFRGPLNDLIYELAGDEFLRKKLKITNDASPSYVRMTDAEFVLRFFILVENWTTFSGNFSREMDRFMQENRSLSQVQLRELKTRFNRAIAACKEIWGDQAFQRPLDGEIWRDQTIAGMYDAQMIAVDSFKDDELSILGRERSAVLAETRALFEHTSGATLDQSFEDAVRTGTNTPSKVSSRISLMTSTLRRLL